MRKISNKILDRQIKAIEGSIRKWEIILYEDGCDNGTATCACCRAFHCNSCPINIFVKGSGGCDGTPYIDWFRYVDDHMLSLKVFDENSRTLANKELVFLFEVRRWLIVKRFFS